MRAAARANTEKASKRSDAGVDPTRWRGRPESPGKRTTKAPGDPAGVLVAARMARADMEQGKSEQASRWRHHRAQRPSREGRGRPVQMADGSVRLMRRGNARGGKGP